MHAGGGAGSTLSPQTVAVPPPPPPPLPSRWSPALKREPPPRIIILEQVRLIASYAGRRNVNPQADRG
jgi:hypothetical protein